jgi:hypothetical protein
LAWHRSRTQRTLPRHTTQPNPARAQTTARPPLRWHQAHNAAHVRRWRWWRRPVCPGEEARRQTAGRPALPGRTNAAVAAAVFVVQPQRTRGRLHGGLHADRHTAVFADAPAWAHGANSQRHCRTLGTAQPARERRPSAAAVVARTGVHARRPRPASCARSAEHGAAALGALRPPLCRVLATRTELSSRPPQQHNHTPSTEEQHQQLAARNRTNHSSHQTVLFSAPRRSVDGRLIKLAWLRTEWNSATMGVRWHWVCPLRCCMVQKPW